LEWDLRLAELSRQGPVFLIRDGHRYVVADISKTGQGEQPLATFKMIAPNDRKSYSLVQSMPAQFFADLDKFNLMRDELRGMAFVIEMRKNPDGTGQISYEVMGMSDPRDKHYM